MRHLLAILAILFAHILAILLSSCATVLPDKLTVQHTVETGNNTLGLIFDIPN